MDDDHRASLIRILVLLLIIGGGIWAGLRLDLPGFDDPPSAEPAELKQVDEDNFPEVIRAANRLTVVNLMLDGQPDAGKLQKILFELQKEKRFGEQVAYTELNLLKQKKFGNAQGIDLEDFSGQLDFYAAGYKLGSLRGPADRPKVEETIQRYLSGLVKRFGPGWLPEVEGMRRAGEDTPVLEVLPTDPVPGMTPRNRPAPQPGTR